MNMNMLIRMAPTNYSRRSQYYTFGGGGGFGLVALPADITADL